MKTKIAIVSIMLGFAIMATPVMGQGRSPLVRPSVSPSPAGLSQFALRACQARQDAIKTRMMSLTRLATNIEMVFGSIAVRVEDFYTNKVVPSGKSLGNYNALVADIATKKGIADTDLASAESLVNSFSCTSDDPRGLLTNFRLDMQKVKSDLKDYRTSIKNLIVAVRTLAPAASPEAKPTESPEASPGM